MQRISGPAATRKAHNELLGKIGMKRERLVTLSAALWLSLICAGSAGAKAPDYGKLPLGFEANAGQTDSRVKFLARGPRYSVFLTGDAAVLTLPNGPTGARSAERVIRMKLVGANHNARVSGADELPGKTNYFIGNDPSKWRTHVPNYAGVRYADVFPGVDLVYHGNLSGQLEYDFVVAPGADPSAIRFTVAEDRSGLNGSAHRAPVRIGADGDLVVNIGGGEIRFDPPVVYQVTGNSQRIVRQGRFVLTASHQVRFALGAYDHSKALIIDPSLVYSTYLGGSNYDQGFGIAVDSAGNAYVAGYAGSTNFPTVNPLPNMPVSGAFVTKFNPAGSALLYSTYLGGTGPTQANAIAVDSAGSAYVAGQTRATDFPTVNPVQPSNTFNNQDAFVSKLSPDGSALVYSTYLGGNTPDEEDGGGQAAWSIAVDSTGNAYVTGNTLDTDFPTVNPLQATNKTSAPSSGTGFVAKYNAAGSALIYSTFLGGSAQDTPWGIAADSNGNAYVTGETISVDFPTANPFQSACNGCPGAVNAFVTKINATGTAFIYSTFLGGSDTNVSLAIAADASGNAYVTGTTTATDFPTVNPLQATNHGNGDAFITKINPSGSALVYSTYVGGSTGGDVGRGIAVDSSGAVYVAGSTGSTDFPTVNPVQATKIGGAGPDTGFVLNLNAAGSALIYSTYLGGNLGERAQAIAVDSSGSAYVTGYTFSLNFPTASPFQAANNGNANAFVTKLSAGGAVSPPPTVTISAAPTTITVGQSSTLTWSSTNATSCSASGAWSGAQATSGTVGETPTATGSSTYTLTCNGAGGSANAAATLTVNAAAPTVTLSINPTSITLGQSATLTWSSTNATSCTANGAWTGTQPTSGTLTVTPTAAGTPSYTLSCSGAAATTAMSAVSETVTVPQTTVTATSTALSGKAGGGAIEPWSLIGLAVLAAWRLRQAFRFRVAALCVIALFAMLAAARPVSAQEATSSLQFNWDQTYVGIRAGRSTYWESSGQLDADLARYGETGTSTSIDQHRTIGVVYAAVPFYKALSLELGLADLGEYPVGISTTSSNIPQLAQTIIRNLSSAGRALTLNLAAPLNITSWFAVEPRIGALGFQSRQEVYTPLGTFSHDREGGGIDAGLALLLRPMPKFYVGAAVDCFDTGGGRCDVLMYSAEIEYHFGR
jgi:Beta-propeller repeat